MIAIINQVVPVVQVTSGMDAIQVASDSDSSRPSQASPNEHESIPIEYTSTFQCEATDGVLLIFINGEYWQPGYTYSCTK